MNKKFDVIPVEDYAVVVDKESKVSHPAFFLNTFCERVEQKENSDYGEFEPDKMKVKINNPENNTIKPVEVYYEK